jgi:hypothetical protein
MPDVSHFYFYYYMLLAGSGKESLKIRDVRFDRGAAASGARKALRCQSGEIPGWPTMNFCICVAFVNILLYEY